MSAPADPNFLAAFGFGPENIDELIGRLIDYDGFIAGGAALYWFLGLESPADQDLDIWIPSRCRRGPDHENRHVALTTLPDGRPDLACYAYDRVVAEQMERMLGSMGFAREGGSGARFAAEGRGMPSDIPYHKNPEFQRVVKVIHDYRRGGGAAAATGRKIQVIYYYGDTRPLDGFDLDVCKIAVYPTTPRSMFQFRLPEGLVEEDVRARRMRITNTSCRENLFRRMTKYFKRGFVLVGVSAGADTGDE